MSLPAISPPPSTGRQPLGRRLAFGATLILGVLVVPLGLAEMALRLWGYGYDPSFLLHRRLGGREVWTDNPKFTFRFFPPRLARSGQPLVVDATKPGRVTRIVVLGESAAMGDPDPAFGLPRQLETLLEARYPGREFEVINAGITAINSYAFPSIAEGCTALGADAWVIYAGHNEVMGPFGPGTVFGGAGAGSLVRSFGLALQRWRVGQALAAAARSMRSGSTTNEEWAGMEMFLGSQIDPADPRLADTARDFRLNLDSVVARARTAGTAVLLVTPASNLRDCAPFSAAGAEPKAELAGALASVTRGDITNALSRLAELDRGRGGENALVQFVYGRTRLLAGDPRGATNLAAARDEDSLPFRATSRIIEEVRKVAALHAGDSGVALVDAEKELREATVTKAPGQEFFWEHVHLNFHGNYTLAKLIADGLGRQLPREATASATPTWPEENEVAARLAYTDWHRHRSLETIRARLDRPPFSHQANRNERAAQLATELARLKPALQATAFEAQATLCRQAIARRTNDWVLRDQFALLLDGFGDHEEAAKEWAAAAALAPNAILVQYRLGKVLSQEATTLGEAEAHLRQALGLREDFPEAWESLGEVLGKRRAYGAADQAFVRALELRPVFTVAGVNRGLTLAAAGRTNEAIGVVSATAASEPANPLAWGRLARLLASAGRNQEAAESWEKVVALRPELFSSQYEAGLAWQHAGHPERAEPHWLAALRLNPDNAEAHYHLGVELAQEKKFAEAAGEFGNAIRLKPALQSAHLNLGVALMALHRPDEALTAFEKAAQLDPADSKARDYVRTTREYLSKPH